MLCKNRSSDSENQAQNSCAGTSNCFHRCYLIPARRVCCLPQALCRHMT
jgi:hypothetical protein